VLRVIGVAVLVLLVLAFIAVSLYFMEVSSGRRIWERIVYWVVLALFIIVASCLLLTTIMYTAYIILEETDKWKPGF